ncbi:MAG: DUF6036 family nucleotidyltransferase [Chthoniobacteraceae bacterium]
MRLRSLIHLAKISRALTGEVRLVVLGSSSLLAFHPALGEPGQPLDTSYDADFLIEGCDESLARVVNEAIGSESLFMEREGYHADILRPAITSQLPPGWDERLAPLNGCEGTFCIEPHDLAVAKLHAGRPKDIDLLAALLKAGLLEEETIRGRLGAMVMEEKLILFTHRNLDSAIALARGK